MTTKHANKDKLAELAESLRGAGIIGEVVSWSAGGKHPYKKVVDALKRCSLNEKLCQERSPADAFSRAKRRLEKEWQAVIDDLRADADEVTYQVTQKKISKGTGPDQERWKYSERTLITLRKVSGDVKCPVKDMEALAKNEIARCIDERTTSDITRLVQALLDEQAEGNPAALMAETRKGGGSYFVPVEFTPFIDRVHNFLTELGGDMIRFPCADTAQGRKSAQITIADFIRGRVESMRGKVAEFDTETRGDTFARKAEEYKAAKFQVESLAHYLGDQARELLKEIKHADQELTVTVSNIGKKREKMPPKESRNGHGRTLVWGFPVTQFIRWAGSQSWGVKDVGAVLAGIEVPCPEYKNVCYQLSLGRRGQGSMATPTESQIKEINKVLRESRKEKV